MAFRGQEEDQNAVFLMPLTLQNVADLGDPSERVPLGERLPFEIGLDMAYRSHFEGFENLSQERLLRLRLFWSDPKLRQQVRVDVRETIPAGPLNFSCSHCTIAGRQARTCVHQWASFVTLWRVLTQPASELQHEEQVRLSEEIKNFLTRGESSEQQSVLAEFEDTELESISVFFDDAPLLKGESMGRFLLTNISRYKRHDISRDKELLSPRLWNLPEVFRKKLSAYSEHYFNEVNLQNYLTDLVRYNFSNGVQISAREILRHPLHKKVPGDLLPQTRSAQPDFNAWQVLPQNEGAFISQSVQDVADVMQELLGRIARSHRQKKLTLFMQSKSHPGKGMQIASLEFEPRQEFSWRVDFRERQELETEFHLLSFRKRPLRFYDSVAVDEQDQALIVFSWKREFSQLQEVLSILSEDLFLKDRERPVVDVVGEVETRAVLKFLRSRPIPVEMSGESKTLSSEQSRTELRLDETGRFFLQHEARVLGEKNLLRKGWSSKTGIYLQALSQGLPLLLGGEARELATRARSKREWDLRILKHLGLLQYVCLETLSFHFEGHLTDGRVVTPETLFSSLHEKIKTLLIAGGTGTSFVRDLPLTELCSRSVLASFESFVDLTLKSCRSSEAFYSEQGELILEGVSEREMRLIYVLLQQLALSTAGDTFRKARVPFLLKVSEEDLLHVPQGATHKPSAFLRDTLEVLQPLIPHGFRIFYKDQPLQELSDDEFKVDFLLQNGSDPRFLNWFELNPTFFLRGEEVDPDRFLSLGGGGVVEYEGKLFLVPQKQLPSLKRLERFWEKLQRGKAETQKRGRQSAVYHLPRHQTLDLLALRASGVAIRGNHEWQELCEFYDSLGASDRLPDLSESTKSVLKPYQASGVRWLQDLHRLRLGGLLADDMGLGKTLQTLAFLDRLHEKEELGQVLIVVPSSLIFNWQAEAQKFTPKLPLAVFTNRDRESVSRRVGAKEPLVVITTYGLLLEHGDFLSQYKWKILIFDEAQNLKNLTAKRTTAARALNAQFKICLTGTPMENHYGEFYSLVDLLVPGSLGPLEDFRHKFVNTEMVTREEMEDLKLKIKPLMLRRSKKEILDQLPEKQETKVSIAFEERQREIYRDIALSYNQRVQETMAVQGEASVQLQMLTALLRLRQACSDPAALPNVHYEKVPPKLETLMDSLQEIVESGESALVFTQFLQTLEHTEKILKNAGIPVYVLHGAIPTKKRQEILAGFTSTKGGAVLVMTLKTGGVGLNLTKASYVFHLEPWWNPSVENQATDRAHRLGQSKAVQVFRYIMHESLEEKIELLKDRKNRKFQALLGDTEKELEPGTGGSSALSKEDFDFLIGLK